MRTWVTIERETALMKLLSTRQIDRIIFRAGKTALRDMRSEASKRVRQKKRMKVKYIGRAIRMLTPGGRKLTESTQWALEISRKATRISDYAFKETDRGGVRVEINKGKPVFLANAFVAKMKSGHVGVFFRRGPKRLPITEPLTSSAYDVISGEAEHILERGSRSMRATAQRLLRMELGMKES